MTGTFKKIDYRLRPAKQAERYMLMEIYRRLRFHPIESYRYFGLGSVAFVDFRMIHRGLGIRTLTSIENVDSDEERRRFRKNRPIRGISMRFGNTKSVLPTIDFSKPSIVWLDYDGSLARFMANDIATVARSAPSGTFIAVTFTTAFPTDPKNSESELSRLKDDFPEYLSDDVKPLIFQNGLRHAQFGRDVLGALLDRAIRNADAGEPDQSKRRAAFQVCFFRYKDGAWMATVGWVIVAERDLECFETCLMDDLPFVRTGRDPFKIEVPLVTPFEVSEMEKRLPLPATDSSLDWIPLKEKRSFAEIHRYLPSFSAIEPF